MANPVVARLNKLYPQEMTRAEAEQWCIDNAAAIEASVDSKGRPATHFTVEFEPHHIISPCGPDALAPFVRWSEVAASLLDLTSLDVIVRARYDKTPRPDRVPSHYLQRMPLSTWRAKCMMVGYSGNAVWTEKLERRIDRVAPPQDVAHMIPYADATNYSVDENGLKNVHADSVLLDDTITVPIVVERLCDFADTIGASSISVANKWHDWHGNPPEPIRWDTGGNYPVGAAVRPGSAIRAYEEAVRVAAGRGKLVVSQRYDPDSWGLWTWPDETRAATTDYTRAVNVPGSEPEE